MLDYSLTHSNLCVKVQKLAVWCKQVALNLLSPVFGFFSKRVNTVKHN